MHRRLAITTAITALAAAAALGPVPIANGSVANTLPEQSSQPTRVTAPPSQSQLRAALLTAADLPSGFSASKSVIAGHTYTGCPALQKVIDSRTAFPSYVEANFSKGLFGPFVVEAIAAGSDQQVRNGFNNFNTALSTCRAPFTGSDGKGGTATYTLAPLSAPKLGDSTQAIRMTSKEGLITATSDVVGIRRGNTVITVMNISTNGAPDAATTRAIARKALQKYDAQH